MRGISERTAQRQWEKAGIDLHCGIRAELRSGRFQVGDWHSDEFINSRYWERHRIHLELVTKLFGLQVLL